MLRMARRRREGRSEGLPIRVSDVAPGRRRALTGSQSTSLPLRSRAPTSSYLGVIRKSIDQGGFVLYNLSIAVVPCSFNWPSKVDD